MFPQVATYAAVLDRLNGAMLKDWRVLEACHEIWVNSHNYGDYYQRLGPFVTVKYSLIDIGIEKFLPARSRSMNWISCFKMVSRWFQDGFK